MRLLFEYTPGMDLTELGGTFTRATTATYVDRNGVVRTAAAGVLRDGHFINGVRYALLEKASTNLVLQSENFGTTWTPVNAPTRVAAAHTASGVTLDLIGDDSATLTKGYQQSVAFSGNGAKAVSLYVRQDTSSQGVVHLQDLTAVQSRLFAEVAWSGGVPVVVTSGGGAGTYLGYESLASGVFRLLFVTTSVTAANSHIVEVFPANAIGGAPARTGAMYFGGVQVENSEYPTSYSKTTTATVTRNADDLYFPFTHAPQAMTAYTKLVDLGLSLDSAFPGVWAIGTGPALYLYRSGAGILGIHHNSTAGDVEVSGAAISVLNVVEARDVLGATGSVTHGQSVNGAAESISGPSAANALATAWTPGRIWVGSRSGATGAVAISVLRIMAGEQTIATMRAPLTYIRFTDSAGTAYLANEKPYPGNRFAGFTPDSQPFGDAATTLARGAVVRLRLRDDFSAALELPHIPSGLVDGEVPVELAERLKYHLLNGGTCLVQTGDYALNSYVCGLRPGTMPQLSLTDRRTMEYTLAVQLLNLAASPSRMLCRYGES